MTVPDDASHVALDVTLHIESVRVPPPPPYVGDVKDFEPFAVGYIELPEGVRVEARLLEADASRLKIGMEMELAVEPFSVDGEGREVVTFAFAPVAA